MALSAPNRVVNLHGVFAKVPKTHLGREPGNETFLLDVLRADCASAKLAHSSCIAITGNALHGSLAFVSTP